MSQQSGNTGSTSGISGLWVTTGGWLTIGIYTYGAVDTTYTMDLQFLSLANLEGGIQDDAGSGADAGSGESDAIHVNDYNNMTNNTLFFEGWNHGDVDTTDRYTFDVPANFGYNVLLQHDGISYYAPGYNTWLLLDIFGTGSANIAYGAPTYSSSTPSWNSSSTSAYYGCLLYTSDAADE